MLPLDFPNKSNIPLSKAYFCLLSFRLDEVIQFTAITWLREFVALSGRTMLPFCASILSAVLPCVSYDLEEKKRILFTIKKC